MTDILFQDAVDQLAALETGQVGARELLAASVARTDALGTVLNAVVARDLDRAFAEADRIDQARTNGEPLGVLAGLPMTVKDTLDVEGLPASAGLRALLDRPATDAAVVAKVRVQDAVVWGKTNTPVKAGDWQTFNALYGTTTNPWDPARTCGGSSGGSAAAVASGLTALEIGADIGGSLRIPAAFCGIFAHKPTWGLVSQRGLVPPVGVVADMDLAVVGPMARSARDLRLLLSVLADTAIPATAPPAELKGLRVGLWLDEPAFPLDAVVRATIEAFAARLAGEGAHVELVPSPIAAERLISTYTLLLFPLTNGDSPPVETAIYELLRGPAKRARRMGAGPLSWAQGVLGATARHAEWRKADEDRARMGHELRRLFERHDVILAPIAPTSAFPHDHKPLLSRRLKLEDGRGVGHLNLLNWPALATTCGLPATAVPVGLDPSGLPVGVQVIGPRGGDALTLAVAQAIDERLGGFRRSPL